MLTSTVLVAVFLVLCLIFGYKRTRRFPLPPHVGSLSNASGYRWEVYAKRAQILGSLISASTFGTSIVIINTKQAAFELLEKRSTFACRPRWPMVELLGRQDNVGFTYYGERLKKLRKVLQKPLNLNTVMDCWSDLLSEQSFELCRALLNTSEWSPEVVEANVQELIVAFTYGHKPDADFIETARAVMRQTGEALQPGRWLVNFIPVLRWMPAWMPGAGFQIWARDARNLFYKMARAPFYELKRETIREHEHLSFVTQSLRNLPEQHSPEEEDVIMFAAGSLFSAAFLLTFIAMMVAHPDVQRRAYEEIGEVVGQSGVPGLHHRSALPFIDCIIKEVHRLHPAIPLIPHSNYKAEEYTGFQFPKKSWVMANVWAMLHDEHDYPNANEFLPRRFEPRFGRAVPPDPRTLVYGFGRRRCPGAHFADIYLFFEFEPPVLKFTAGLVAFPKPFTCKLIPRPNALEILSKGTDQPCK